MKEAHSCGRPLWSGRTKRAVPTADHGIGKRWQVRYRDLDGHQRKENFHTKAEADNRAAEVDVEIRRGSYAVPAETKQTLGAYARKWLDANSVGPTTALRYEATVRNHIAEHLGQRELRSLNQPSIIQGWVRTLQDSGLEVSTIEGIFDILSSILGMAVEDGLLPKNLCKAKSVKLPTATMSSSESRTRKAIDDAFTETEAEAEDDGGPPAAQGTSAPPAKPMCPQCALAA